MSVANTPIDDMGDDLYGTPSAVNTPNQNGHPASNYLDAKSESTAQNGQASSAGAIPGIPGLGMLATATSAAATAAVTVAPTTTGSVDGPAHSAEPRTEKEEGDVADVQMQTAPAQPTSEPTPAEKPLLQDGQETAAAGALAAAPSADSEMKEEQVVEEASNTTADPTAALLDLLGQTDDVVPPEPSHSKGKQPVDREFIEAAKAQNGNEEAEWQYNTSDEESSSDDSSDDSSSEEDSDDEDYEMLDPATAARMLMEDAGEDDDGGDKASKSQHVRTKNEKPPEVVPKPDVTVTADMKITALGAVTNIVDNMILVKANTSGEYQVLESGSVLCMENREVIGAVAETLGRVQEPLYVVAFTKPSDIAEAGIIEGSDIFYVDAHSTFVFTEPLKNLKGTDASNLHDEELPEEEMEFSDDEAEAANKRAKKEAKKNRNADKNPQKADVAQQPVVQPYTGGVINYDDEPDEAYTPLARPDNLQQMLSHGAPVEERARQPFPGRGRGDRGRGRGRGDRGRGDRGRGGRGGGDAARGGRKGLSKSYPDNHNQQSPNTYQHQPLPQKPAAPQSWSGSQPQQSPLASGAQSSVPQFGQSQMQFSQPQPPQAHLPFQPPQAHANVPMAWPQMANPQQYQQFQHFLNNFNGQAGQQQQFQFPQVPPPTPGGSIPAGAFVNPTFFQGQQQPSPQPQQHYNHQPVAAQGPSPEAVQGAQELLRRLGGQQQ
ncbi:hypothetical protein AAFC00_001020 [Neodothiora populina]|uniref:H/ACA ribonucleoprotein complex non-core subunit NAF1 n=1 Tax=Neodothiora populina TaxID=2781224 RepID=A0ABR3PMI9_9PEZI